MTVGRRRAAVTEVRETVGRSMRWACRVVGLALSTWYYQARRDPQPALRARLRELAEAKRRDGSPRLYDLLRRQGWRVNHKRVERLYREEGLQVATPAAQAGGPGPAAAAGAHPAPRALEHGFCA